MNKYEYSLTCGKWNYKNIQYFAKKLNLAFDATENIVCKSDDLVMYSALFKGANTLYLAKTIAPHWRRGTTVPIVMTSDYQCPSNSVVRDIQRRGSPAVRGKRQGGRGGAQRQQ